MLKLNQSELAVVQLSLINVESVSIFSLLLKMNFDHWLFFSHKQGMHPEFLQGLNALDCNLLSKFLALTRNILFCFDRSVPIKDKT